MKTRGQLVLYAVSTAAQLGISIGCALWPLRHYLHHLNTWRRWHQAWTVSDSDLDVCLEGLAFWLAASVFCLLAVLLRRRSSQGTPSRRLKAVKWLLLAVALVGQASWSWGPSNRHHSGRALKLRTATCVGTSMPLCTAPAVRTGCQVTQ